MSFILISPFDLTTLSADKLLSNISVDKTLESKYDIDIKDIHELKEILFQMVTFVDDIKTKIEEKEASKL